MKFESEIVIIEKSCDTEIEICSIFTEICNESLLKYKEYFTDDRGMSLPGFVLAHAHSVKENITLNGKKFNGMVIHDSFNGIRSFSFP